MEMVESEEKVAECKNIMEEAKARTDLAVSDNFLKNRIMLILFIFRLPKNVNN